MLFELQSIFSIYPVMDMGSLLGTVLALFSTTRGTPMSTLKGPFVRLIIIVAGLGFRVRGVGLLCFRV